MPKRGNCAPNEPIVLSPTIAANHPPWLGISLAAWAIALIALAAPVTAATLSSPNDPRFVANIFR